MKFFADTGFSLIGRVRQGRFLQAGLNKKLRRPDEMENNPTWIPVVALALFDEAGRVLMQQRPIAKHHGGYWEFPGGKVEIGENPRVALVRECAEELAITLDPAQLEPSFFAEEADAAPVVLFLYISHQRGPQPEGKDGQAWDWFALEEAARLPLAPMDRALLAQIAGTGS